MRKYLSIPSLSVVVDASATVAGPLAGMWSSSDSVAVRDPLMIDSVIPRGEMFEFSSLLSLGLRHKTVKEAMLVSDTAGMIALSVPGLDDATLRVLQPVWKWTGGSVMMGGKDLYPRRDL